jgi:hypothetical protein
MKKASFGDTSLTMYRWSPSLEIIPGTEKCELHPTKMEAENMNNTSFLEASQTMYRWSQSLEIVQGTKKCLLLLMEMGRKQEKYE